MAQLKKYDITTDKGFTTTVKLSDVDAKRRGLLGKDVDSRPKPKTAAKKAPAPKNKQAPAPKNKQEPDTPAAKTDGDSDGATGAATDEKAAEDETAKAGFGAAFENKN